MLLQSLLEPTPQQRQRRRWATLISFLAQMIAVGVLVILPLLYTEALPHLAAVTDVPAPPPPPGRPPSPAQARSPRNRASSVQQLGIHVPSRIPSGIDNRPDPQPAVDVHELAWAVPDSTGPGDPNGVWNSIFARPAAPPPSPPPTRRAPLRVSEGVSEGMRIRQVAPAYPKLAQAAGIEGEVRLSAVIDRDGNIEDLRVLSGHPLLVRAAVDAVRQWRYRPYSLNGEPVEVATQITVRFVLSR